MISRKVSPISQQRPPMYLKGESADAAFLGDSLVRVVYYSVYYLWPGAAMG